MPIVRLAETIKQQCYVCLSMSFLLLTFSVAVLTHYSYSNSQHNCVIPVSYICSISDKIATICKNFHRLCHDCVKSSPSFACEASETSIEIQASFP